MSAVSRRVLLQNSGANVVRIIAASLIALVLPPFLVHRLPGAVYGTWVLVLQLSAYLGYLDFGIQTAVGRFVARATEMQDFEGRDRVVSTAFALLSAAATAGLFLLGSLVWLLPVFFQGIPADLYDGAQLALLLVGGSLALGLPANIFASVFLALQRSEVPTVISIVCRLLGALLTGLAVYLHGGLVAMAGGVAVSSLVTSLLSYLACRRFVPDLHLRYGLISRQTGKALAADCISLSVWSFSMLLVSGFDTAIVGYFDFKAVGYYAIATTLTNFVIQIQGAVFAALMPVAAVLDAQKDNQRLVRLLVNSTRYGMFILLCTGLPLFIAARPILTLWVGETYASHTALLLQVLVVANIVRLAGAPFANLLIGIGQQRLILLSPVLEGISNLLISVLATAWLGAVGAAIGTLVGAFVSIGMHVFYNLPRVRDLELDSRTWLVKGLLQPLICALPGAIFYLTTLLTEVASPSLQALLAALATGCTALVFWKWGLLENERLQIAALLSKVQSQL